MDDVVNTTIARKVVLLGDQNVGKTCIVLRYVEGTFGSDVTSTIGAFFLTKKMIMFIITIKCNRIRNS